MEFDKERFAELLRRAQGRGRSLRRFAEEAGISASYISRLARGMREEPPTPEVIRKIADVAQNGVTYDDLMAAAGWIDESVTELIRRWREDTPYYRIPSDLYIIPVVGSIAAGIPIDRIETVEGFLAVDPLLLSGAEGFALRVKGDSMSGDRIYDGDVVIVRKQESIEPHEIAVVSVGNEDATLKRVRIINGNAVLLSSNPEYDPIVVPASEVKVIGKVIEVRFFPGRR